jgi:ribosome recycling factor
MVNEALHNAEERMKHTISHLDEDLTHIRTGRATPLLVDKIMVEYYGVPTALNQLAHISIPEPRVIAIKPFDTKAIREIERAIQSSDLGLNPNNDGKLIRVILPPLTEQRRKDLVKTVHHRLEESRVALRNIRRDVQNDLRDFEKESLIREDELERGQKQLQELTDRYVKKIAEIGERKEAEIMQV